MKPKTRQELANLLQPMEIVIELGVAAGRYAEQLLEQNSEIRYIGIDRWSDHHDDQEMYNAIERLNRFKPRVAIQRYTFKNALKLFRDEFADMIYIDGYAHTGQEGGETLRDWWPKLRQGGIYAGHDYDQNYPQTIAAVDAFVAELRGSGLNVELNIIDEKPNCSWWIKKPLDVFSA